MATVTLPGLIDIHTHLRTPGQEEKEDFSTGTKAAVSGGFTAIFDMPNNKVPITTLEKLEEKIYLAKNIYADIGFYFGSLGDNLEEFSKVAGRVKGLKLYLNETTGNFLISKEKLGEIFSAWAKATEKPILVHAEDDAVDAVIQNSKLTKQKVHFCHISLKSDLEQIKKAKIEGVSVTCGVTPHHLFLSREDALALGPYGRMKPFLKSQDDVNYLFENLSDIDVIESDHAPHTKEEKESDTPPFGVPGLETTLPLLITSVHEGKLKLSEVKRLLYDGPRQVLNLKDDTGEIEVDMETEYELKNEDLFTKCAWSPFAGRKVYGKVKKVVMRNEKVFEEGKFIKSVGEVI